MGLRLASFGGIFSTVNKAHVYYKNVEELIVQGGQGFPFHVPSKIFIFLSSLFLFSSFVFCFLKIAICF